MEAMTSVQDKAREALTWFETARRDENDPESSYFRTKDEAPNWVKGLVQHAHGGFLPDDWRYRLIYGALEVIADAGGDPMDDAGEFADISVDVYTSDRLAWLSTNLRRASYCDEATENFGPTDIIDTIGRGQYVEAEEIYGLVVNALED